MKVSDVLDLAWRELEQEESQLPGTYERRVFSHSGKAIYVLLSRPVETSAVQIIASQRSLRGWQELETRGFRLKLEPTPASTAIRIRIELLTTALSDIFRKLCCDVIAEYLAHETEEAAANSAWQRITRWQRFFKNTGNDGLSPEHQIGLYGELCFIRHAIQAGIGAAYVLEAWQGPEGGNQDFAFGLAAVEVKTTSSTRDTRVFISNLRQLDENGLASLFLCRFDVERRKRAGETLPAIVSIVRNLLVGLEDRFTDKLVASGYIETHERHYSDYGYTPRELNCYRVVPGFPRLLSKDIMSGVSEITYAIELAVATEYLVSDETLFSSIKGFADGAG